MLVGLPVYYFGADLHVHRGTGILPVGQPGFSPGEAYRRQARCPPAPQPGWLCSFVLHWIIYETQAFRLHAVVEDAEPRAIQSRDERRGAISSLRVAD